MKTQIELLICAETTLYVSITRQMAQTQVVR
jgi:hypothetical protein